MDEKFNLGQDLVDRLLTYFEQNEDVNGYSREEVGYLFEILPATLKIALLRFLNK